MKFKDFKKCDNDIWLDIFNIIVIVFFYLTFIFGLVFPIYDTLQSTLVCSGGETLIENCIYYYGVFMLKSPFLNWLIWFIMIESVAFINLVIGKLIVSYLTDVKLMRDKILNRKEKEKEDETKDEYKSTEKFERTVSACDYRKWSK